MTVIEEQLNWQTARMKLFAGSLNAVIDRWSDVVVQLSQTEAHSQK